MALRAVLLAAILSYLCSTCAGHTLKERHPTRENDKPRVRKEFHRFGHRPHGTSHSTSHRSGGETTKHLVLKPAANRTSSDASTSTSETKTSHDFSHVKFPTTLFRHPTTETHPTTSTTTTKPTVTAANTATTSSSTTATATTQPTKAAGPHASTDLSHFTIIIICTIAAIVLIVTLACGTTCFLRKRKQKRSQTTPQQHGPVTYHTDPQTQEAEAKGPFTLVTCPTSSSSSSSTYGSHDDRRPGMDEPVGTKTRSFSPPSEPVSYSPVRPSFISSTETAPSVFRADSVGSARRASRYSSLSRSFCLPAPLRIGPRSGGDGGGRTALDREIVESSQGQQAPLPGQTRGQGSGPGPDPGQQNALPTTMPPLHVDVYADYNDDEDEDEANNFHNPFASQYWYPPNSLDHQLAQAPHGAARDQKRDRDRDRDVAVEVQDGEVGRIVDMYWRRP